MNKTFFGIKVIKKSSFIISLIGFIVIPIILSSIFLFTTSRYLLIRSPLFFHASNRYHFSVTNLPFNLHYSQLPNIPGVKAVLNPNYVVLTEDILEQMPFLRVIDYDNNIFFYVYGISPNVSTSYLMSYTDPIIDSLNLLYSNYFELDSTYLNLNAWSIESIYEPLRDYVHIGNMLNFLNLHTSFGHFYNGFEQHLVAQQLINNVLLQNTMYLLLGILITLFSTFIILKSRTNIYKH